MTRPHTNYYRNMSSVLMWNFGKPVWLKVCFLYQSVGGALSLCGLYPFVLNTFKGSILYFVIYIPFTNIKLLSIFARVSTTTLPCIPTWPSDQAKATLQPTSLISINKFLVLNVRRCAYHSFGYSFNWTQWIRKYYRAFCFLFNYYSNRFVNCYYISIAYFQFIR